MRSFDPHKMRHLRIARIEHVLRLIKGDLAREKLVDLGRLCIFSEAAHPEAQAFIRRGIRDLYSICHFFAPDIASVFVIVSLFI